MTSTPLPPGSAGLPVFGEALTLARDPFAWVRTRAEAHGPVVRSRILNRDVALLSGQAAAAAFIDEANVSRAGGLPPHAAALFGAGAVNQLDGPAHRVRKQHLMRALDADALAAYEPAIRTALRERMSRWAAVGEVSLQSETARASIGLLLASLAGIAEDEATLDRYTRGYMDFGRALLGLPLALPGTPLRRARSFTTEMRERYAALAGSRHTAPTGDGLSRLVASEVDGQRMTPEDIGVECHHLVFAGSGLWGWMCLGTRVLAEDPAMVSRLRGADLGSFVDEVKRVALLVPFTSFGTSKRDFVVEGVTVPAGWLVAWSTHASHTVPRVCPYSHPERFDPERFARGEGAGVHAFSPQGPGDALTSHRCGGVEYSTLALRVYFEELLRGPAFSLPEQDLSLDPTSIPAGYRSGLRARFEPV